jgi:hypothetical protein
MHLTWFTKHVQLGAREFPPTTHQASLPIPPYVNKNMAESSRGVSNQVNVVDEDVRVDGHGGAPVEL